MIGAVHDLPARARGLRDDGLRDDGTDPFVGGDHRVKERKIFGLRVFRVPTVVQSECEDRGGEYQNGNPHQIRWQPYTPHNRRY